MRLFTSVLGSAILFLIIGDFALAGALKIFVRKPRPFDVPPALAKDLLTCRRFRAAAYYHWRRLPCRTPLVNVDPDGIRKTVKNPAPGAKKVFCFGGSTTWGYTSDAETVPSQLQRILGSNFSVYNFGEDAFTSVQALNLLLERLSMGDRPADVIFLGGAMDTYVGAYSPAVPRGIQSLPQIHSPSLARLVISAFRQSAYGQLEDLLLRPRQRRKDDQTILASLPTHAREVVHAYSEFVKQVRALGRLYGFRSYFFWEPDLLTLTKHHLAPYEKKIIEGRTIDDFSPVATRVFQTVYNKIKSRVERRELKVVWLGDLFDDHPEQVFHDDAHLDGKGNALVAKKIAQVIQLRGKTKLSNSGKGRIAKDR